MHKIATHADVASALSDPLAVVYKHSPICPTSDIAYREMRLLRQLHRDVPVYLVDVVHSRPLSRRTVATSRIAAPGGSLKLLRGSPLTSEALREF